MNTMAKLTITRGPLPDLNQSMLNLVTGKANGGGGNSTGPFATPPVPPAQG